MSMPDARAADTGGLMRGKRGLVMGVANDHSIAWGIAKALYGQGAELAFTYQGEALGKRVQPLAESLGAALILPCDVEELESVDQVFSAIEKKWGGLDFVVNSLAYSARAGGQRRACAISPPITARKASG